jgi:erythromycin esterase-like protein
MTTLTLITQGVTKDYNSGHNHVQEVAAVDADGKQYTVVLWGHNGDVFRNALTLAGVTAAIVGELNGDRMTPREVKA